MRYRGTEYTHLADLAAAIAADPQPGLAAVVASSTQCLAVALVAHQEAPGTNALDAAWLRLSDAQRRIVAAHRPDLDVDAPRAR